MFFGVNPSPDVLYMRFLKDGKTFRVAKMSGGLCAALYPSQNPDIFYGEAFHEIDDESPKKEVRRSEIKDPILLELLSEKTIEQIVAKYEPSLENQYYLCRRGERDVLRRLNSGTFEITEEQERELVSA
jgi:hypothetical protein